MLVSVSCSDLGCFTTTTPVTRFHLILPAMKSNANRFFFVTKQNFISGLT